MPKGMAAAEPTDCVDELNEQLVLDPEIEECAVSSVGYSTTSQDTMERKHTVWALTVPSWNKVWIA